jgi:hypothetical protein
MPYTDKQRRYFNWKAGHSKGKQKKQFMKLAAEANRLSKGKKEKQ